MHRLLALAMLFTLGCSSGRATAVHGEVSLVVLHTSDTHSALFPFRERIGWSDARRGLGVEGAVERIAGFSRLSTLVKRERSLAERSVLFDSGDAFQGSLAFDAWGGEAELLGLAALGVSAQALGNHELDRGAENLRERYRELATFPLLAANYAVDGEASVREIALPFVVLDVSGLRLGVIGVGNARSVPELRERPNELGVLALRAAAAVQSAVDELRPLVDLIVVLTHVGLDADLSLIRETSGLDLVLGGHQHIALDEPFVALDCGGSGEGSVRDAWGRSRRCTARRVVVVHSGAHGKYLGKLGLTLDDDRVRLGATYDPLDAHEITGASFELLPASSTVAEDAAVRELLEPYRSGAHERFGLGDVVAFAPASVQRVGATGADSPLGNFSAEAARRAARAELSIIGASSLRSDLPEGPLDAETLEQSFPFDDPVLRVAVTGHELARAFERAATSAAERDCRTAVHVAGVLVRFACPCESPPCAAAFVGETDICCQSDADCAVVSGACSATTSVPGRCVLPVSATETYALATTSYLADGNGGFFGKFPENSRELAAEGLREAVAGMLGGVAPCAPGSPSCESGCQAALQARVEEAFGAGSDALGCERARAICDALPCLDDRAGALRDGRLRIEPP